jgi:hypothetical protein
MNEIFLSDDDLEGKNFFEQVVFKKQLEAGLESFRERLADILQRKRDNLGLIERNEWLEKFEQFWELIDTQSLYFSFQNTADAIYYGYYAVIDSNKDVEKKVLAIFLPRNLASIISSYTDLEFEQMMERTLALNAQQLEDDNRIRPQGGLNNCTFSGAPHEAFAMKRFILHEEDEPAPTENDGENEEKNKSHLISTDPLDFLETVNLAEGTRRVDDFWEKIGAEGREFMQKAFGIDGMEDGDGVGVLSVVAGIKPSFIIGGYLRFEKIEKAVEALPDLEIRGRAIINLSTLRKVLRLNGLEDRESVDQALRVFESEDVNLEYSELVLKGIALGYGRTAAEDYANLRAVERTVLKGEDLLTALRNQGEKKTVLDLAAKHTDDLRKRNSSSLSQSELDQLAWALTPLGFDSNTIDNWLHQGRVMAPPYVFMAKDRSKEKVLRYRVQGQLKTMGIYKKLQLPIA